MVKTGSNPREWVTVDKTEEKGSDVNLASHFLLDAFTRKFDLAVLITNDSDLAEPVRIVRDVVNLPVGIINPHQRHSVTLKQYATFIRRIRENHLRQSQFPPTMNDAKGSFQKPSIYMAKQLRPYQQASGKKETMAPDGAGPYRVWSSVPWASVRGILESALRNWYASMMRRSSGSALRSPLLISG